MLGEVLLAPIVDVLMRVRTTMKYHGSAWLALTVRRPASRVRRTTASGTGWSL
jgi:hypothetical protein